MKKERVDFIMEIPEIVMVICLFIPLGICGIGLAIFLVAVLIKLAIDIFKGEL